MVRKLSPLTLAPEAENDFAFILRSTNDQWGEAQMYAYRAILDNALLSIRQHPNIGYAKPQISSAHRIFVAGHHLIIYRVKKKIIYVSRILHERMDIARHF